MLENKTSIRWDAMRSLALTDAVGPSGRVIGGPFGSELTQADYTHSGVPVIRVSNQEGSTVAGDFVFVSKSKAEALKANTAFPGDIIVVQRGSTYGKVSRIPCDAPHEKYIVCQSQMAVTVDPQFADPDYIFQYLRSEKFQRYIASSVIQTGQPHINLDILRKGRIDCPSLPVQRKIAEILRTWDDAIQACERRGQALRRQVDGLRLRLFEAAYGSDNRARHAKELFEPVSEKKQSHLPLLAVMQDIGVVRRDELDRRVVMPDGDVDGYKVVREGDFVISLRSFEGGLEYSRVNGLVSPAYTVLRPTTGDYVGEYYRHFFKSKSFIGRLDKLIFGIRDGKQIAFRDFGDMKIPNPPREEQEAAAEVLGMAERQIRLTEQEALALQKQKRGLMQKLLTGKWRVKANA